MIEEYNGGFLIDDMSCKQVQRCRNVTDRLRIDHTVFKPCIKTILLTHQSLKVLLGRFSIAFLVTGTNQHVERLPYRPTHAFFPGHHLPMEAVQFKLCGEGDIFEQQRRDTSRVGLDYEIAQPSRSR